MSFIDHGYATIESCFSPVECERISSQLEGDWQAGSRCLLDHDWCQVLADELRRRVAAEIPAVKDLVAVQCTFFNKSPTSNWLVAFHQDRSIPVDSSTSSEDWPGWSQKEGMTFIQAPDELLLTMVALRLHVDDSTADNGPLRIIPGSHCNGTLSSQQIHELRESSPARAIELHQGSVLAMRPLLLHASSKSGNMTSRRVLHFLFGPRALPHGLTWRRTV